MILPFICFQILMLLSLLLGLKVVFTFAQAPHIEFDSPPASRSISKAWISSIGQTHDGFIWLGAANGLIRFDGYDYTYYVHNPEDSTSISNNFISSIIKDQEDCLWLTTDGGGLNRFDPQTGVFSSFRHDPADDTSISSDRIFSAAEGSDHTLWLATISAGLNHFDKLTGKCIRYVHDPQKANSLIDNNIYAIWEDSTKREVWIGTQKGLDRLDLETGIFTHFSHDPDNPQSLTNNFIMSIAPDSKGRLWVGTRIGLNRYDPEEKGFYRYQYDEKDENSLINDYVFGIYEDSQQRIWVSALGGISLWDENNRYFYNYPVDSDNPKALRSATIWKVFEDDEGRIWVPTYGGGYSIVHQFKQKIEHLSLPLPGSISGGKNFIMQLQEDNNGIVWIASYLGLHSFDPNSKSLRYHCPEWVDPAYWSVWSMARKKNGHLVLINPFWHHEFDPASETFIPGIFSSHPPPGLLTNIAIDSEDNIWLYSNGVNQLFKVLNDAPWWEKIIPDSLFYENETKLVANFLRFDSKNQLWMGTDGGGLLTYQPEAKRFKRFLNQENNPASIASDFITSVKEDNKGDIWIGGRGGLNRLISGEGKGTFQHWSRLNSGLKADLIHNILEDQYGTFWLGTDNGLFHFNPRENKFECYGTQDGLSPYSFDSGAQLRTQDGLLVIGSGNEINLIDPNTIKRNPNPPRVVITDFLLFGRSVPLKGSFADTLDYASPLVKDISITDTIRLKWWQNDITFSFAALNYTLPEKNYYLYQLEGYQPDWIEADAEQRRAVYTNLDPGTYFFMVMASNNDGYWNDLPTQLCVIIRRPWWTTWWAYGIYLLLASALIYLYLNLLVKRRLAQSNASRLRELDTAKTRLYTNISHEFRTPITIIYGMVEQIKNQPEQWFRQGMDLIQKNARQLLNMVNQMLELRKLETGSLSLNYQQGDVIVFLRQLIEPFVWHAKSKNVQLHFLPEEKELWMDFDSEKLIRICSNLLSNAIKFTKADGNIYVMTTTHKQDHTSWLELKVRDTGIGIPSDQLPHVFNRFFQVPNESPTHNTSGTGIGLALIEELVKLMKGTVTVESEEGQGTTFTVMLPIHNEAPVLEMDSEKEMTNLVTDAFPFLSANTELPDSLPADKGNPIALLVDDNPDVITYLWACLHNDYILETVNDGEAGIQKAIELIPDIVISDIMMPGTDGFELCKTLKADERTNHIPIILLTAKADQSSRMAGWGTGADSYLTKPFDPEELQVQMRNLLAVREQIRQHYLLPMEEESTLEEQQSDPWEKDPFVAKTKSIIENHLDNFDLKVQDLCHELHLSHSQFHRKLTAVCGLSPNRFIKHVRLWHARQFLLDPERTITTVAFDTGFQDPDYFGRVFKDTFGMSPSDFRQKNNIET